MSQDPAPSYEDLQARVAELEAERTDARWRLDRLAAIDDPLEKIAVGIWEQVRACGLADRWACWFLDGDRLVQVLQTGPGSPNPGEQAWLQAHLADGIPLDRAEQAAAAVLDDRVIVVADVVGEDGRTYPLSYERFRARETETGFRLHSTLAIPLHSGGEVTGALTVGRLEVRPFTDDDIAAIQPYAGQLALAIGNARMTEQLEVRTRELAEAVERESALAAELREQKEDAERHLKRLAEVENPRDKVLLGIWEQVRAAGLADRRGTYIERDGHLEAVRLGERWVDRDPDLGRMLAMSAGDVAPDAARMEAAAFVSGKPIVVNDVLGEGRLRFPESTAQWAKGAQTAGWESVSAVTMPHSVGGGVVGVTNFMRVGPYRPFTEDDIAAIQPYADQMALAIGNARLAEQLEERNAELAESLEQQTAMAEVLGIIASSPVDSQPVLDAVTAAAARLFAADDAFIFRAVGDQLETASFVGKAGWLGAGGPLGPATPAYAAMRDRRPLHLFGSPDEVRERYPEYPQLADVWAADRTGAAVTVPIIYEDSVFGTLSVRRVGVRPFSEQDIALLQAFADQAAIAIETTAAQQELTRSNLGLAESLEQQTALTDVLTIINTSAGNVQPVLDAVCERALAMAGAESAAILAYEGLTQTILSIAWSAAVRDDDERRTRVIPGRIAETRPGEVGTIAFHRGELIHIWGDRERWESEYPGSTWWWERYGFTRASVLLVPMLRDGRPFAVLMARRGSAEPFAPGIVATFKAFADQAAIAMQNADLLQICGRAIAAWPNRSINRERWRKYWRSSPGRRPTSNRCWRRCWSGLRGSRVLNRPSCTGSRVMKQCSSPV